MLCDTPDGQILNPSGCYMAEVRRWWITQLLSQEWRGAWIPPQRPEIHQLQMPNDLHPASPRVPALWQPLRDMSLGTQQDSWDKMGTEQTPQCRPLWHETLTRCGGIPPHCVGPAPPSHLRQLIYQTHSGAQRWACLSSGPWEPPQQPPASNPSWGL